MVFEPAPTPKGPLGYYRVLCPNASVRVSPLCLGAMSLGTEWAEMLGSCDNDQSFKLLDYFFDQGGNFIDTANNYQNEQSEKILGEWMQARGNRDQLVLATKYTTCYRDFDRAKEPIQINYQGQHAKSLHTSLNASLKKLGTDYIDLLYVHWWDGTTSIPEVMQSLNTMVQQGKVLYLGISDTPAWIVSKANEYARSHGLRTFSVYQGKWNTAERDLERDVIPMCRDENMAICPWSTLGGGHFKSDEQRKAGGGRNFGSASETYLKVSKVLEKVAKDKGTIMTSVALAYVMHKTPNVYPIVGGRKIEHLQSNIEALKLKLSEEEIDEIENAYDFDIGFPLNFLYRGKYKTDQDVSENWLVKQAGHLNLNKVQQPITPRE